MEKKRHHHYVWRYYLRPWTSNERVTCLRNGKIFESNLMGVGQKRDFYKLNELTLKELEFIKKLAIDNTPREHLQKVHVDLVKQFNFVFELKQYISSKGINDPKANDTLDAAIYNLEEDMHARIENSAIKYIESILQEDINFYNTDEGCRDFIFFLCVQYMRTEKMKNSFLESISNFDSVDLEKVWNVLSHIFATNIAWTLYAERKVFKMTLLKNETDKEFVTGDQPVVNTYAVIGESKTPPKEFELFYPVSPRVAILISEREEYKDVRLKLLNESDVISYNNMIIKNSQNQLYATSQGVLEEYHHR